MAEQNGVGTHDESKDGGTRCEESLEGQCLTTETREKVVCHETGRCSEGGIEQSPFDSRVLHSRRRGQSVEEGIM